MKSNEIESDIPNKCPKCGSELKERTGKYGKFLGCTKFPECRYTVKDIRSYVHVKIR